MVTNEQISRRTMQIEADYEHMAAAKARAEIREGTQVKILGNASGTCWETGYVADINPEDEALINFGSKDTPIYGMGIRRQLSELEVI